ncbi:hypothetical protein ACGFJT_37590 [Actinomadura geliboluensis]|uniref:hypothetical protein n=1 Tax=Actinomadura geliboluensis TaxID=882440 RepID=UPI003724AA7B
MYGILRTLPVRWINHPAAIAVADHKPGQLLTARTCAPANLLQGIVGECGAAALDEDLAHVRARMQLMPEHGPHRPGHAPRGGR